MPPVRRKPRRASPRTKRCKYVSPTGDRCVRIATLEGDLCATCTKQIADELGATASSIFEDLASGRISLGDLISNAVTGYVKNAFPWISDAAHAAQQAHQQARQQARPRAEPPPRSRPWPGSSGGSPPPPPRPRGPDPKIIQARKVLGFDTYDQPHGLTERMISERRKELARKYHPDRPGGSNAKMQAINAAADLLIAQLGKQP